MTRTLRAFGVPPRDLDDEVQRTFISAARRIDDIRPGTERSFLFTVAMRMAAHARRTRARRREVISDEVPEPAEAVVTPEYLAGRNQVRIVVSRLVDSLDDALRAVLTLHVFDELGTRETASILGIPQGTAASRFRRARSQLRSKLARLGAAVSS